MADSTQRSAMTNDLPPTAPPTMDELLSEWKGVWLQALRQQVLDLHYRREVHDELLQMLDAQDHPDTGTFRDVFHRMYIESQVMAIRRQADDDPRTLSLRRLIGQLEQHRREFTRSWYVERWMAGMDPSSPDKQTRLESKMHLEFAHDAFDRFTDRRGDPCLGGRRLHQDREDLLSPTAAVVRYANAVVAHAERGPDNVHVTYDEFHAAITHLGDMLRRYELLIGQSGLASATPTIQGDWKGPFRRPLALLIVP